MELRSIVALYHLPTKNQAVDNYQPFTLQKKDSEKNIIPFGWDCINSLRVRPEINAHSVIHFWTIFRSLEVFIHPIIGVLPLLFFISQQIYMANKTNSGCDQQTIKSRITHKSTLIYFCLCFAELDWGYNITFRSRAMQVNENV